MIVHVSRMYCACIKDVSRRLSFWDVIVMKMMWNFLNLKPVINYELYCLLLIHSVWCWPVISIVNIAMIWHLWQSITALEIHPRTWVAFSTKYSQTWVCFHDIMSQMKNWFPKPLTSAPTCYLQIMSQQRGQFSTQKLLQCEMLILIEI